MPNPNFGDYRLVMASDLWLNKMAADQIGWGDPVLMRLKEKGHISESVYGGNKLLEPLLVGFNETCAGLSAPDETRQLQAQGGFDAAEYTFAAYAGNTTFFKRDLNIVQGKAKMLDLVENKLKQTAMSFVELIARDLYSTTAASSGKMEGLGYALNTNYGASPGNISQSANTWWQHFIISNPIVGGGAAAGQTDETLSSFLNRFYQGMCYGGNEYPDIMVMDVNLWNILWEELNEKHRIINVQAKQNFGFSSLVLNGNCEMYWSRWFTNTFGSFVRGSAVQEGNNGDIIAINSNHLYIRSQQGNPFKITTEALGPIPHQPGVAAGSLQHYLEVGLTYSGMRVHGRVTGLLYEPEVAP